MDLTLSKILNKVLPNDVKLQLKKEIEASIKLQEEIQLMTKEYALADGTKLKVNGELAAGTKVDVMQADGTMIPTPMTGEVEVMNEDGSMTVVKVVEGVIAEVEPKEMEMSEEDKAKKAMEDEAKKKAETAMQTQMSKQLSEIESLKNENKSLKDTVEKNTKSINLLLSVFKTLEETPMQEENIKMKSYEDMTPAERYRYNKGLM
ncbi:MAG: hypothetical protein IM600_18725 [Bacteroidetes bacterium]|nr:hypothetical protein [Bacteroidota bacterium]